MKQSSTIKEVRWVDNFLYVTFHAGSTYEYADVPENIYNEFIQAESLGKYFAENIKTKFDWAKVNEDIPPPWPFPKGPNPVGGISDVVLDYNDLLDWTEEEEDTFMDMMNNPDKYGTGEGTT